MSYTGMWGRKIETRGTASTEALRKKTGDGESNRI